LDSILNKDWIIDSKTLSTSVIEQGEDIIILLPGYSIDSKWALKHYPALLKNATCYAINWPGFNGSELIGTEFTIEILNKLISQILSIHKKPGIHLIGHSFGARVAIAYSAKNTEQINQLSLIAPVLSVNPMEKIFSFLPYSFNKYLIKKCLSRNALNRLARFLNSLALLKKAEEDFIVKYTTDQNALEVMQYYALSLYYLQVSKTTLREVLKLIPSVSLYLSKQDPYSDYNYWNKIALDFDNVTVIPLKGGHFGRILE
jgi:pimeloyl-ACP methyl ester carboxylesterase